MLPQIPHKYPKVVFGPLFKVLVAPYCALNRHHEPADEEAFQCVLRIRLDPRISREHSINTSLAQQQAYLDWFCTFWRTASGMVTAYETLF
jgi:hypothetical protein